VIAAASGPDAKKVIGTAWANPVGHNTMRAVVSTAIPVGVLKGMRAVSVIIFLPVACVEDIVAVSGSVSCFVSLLSNH
jgi:hypothetical protein